MDKIQVLLMVNSILLSLLSVLFLIIGYFLKDLHKDFKAMVERVNTLYVEHKNHVNYSKDVEGNLEQRVITLSKRVRKLERNHTSSKTE